MARQNHIFQKIRKGSQAEKLADLLIERPASAGTRSINTVEKLAGIGMGLEITCTGCGCVQTVLATAVVERFGAETPLSEVRPPCGECDTTATSVIPVSG